MPDIPAKIYLFIEPVALTFMLVYIFGQLNRSGYDGLKSRGSMGLIFGLTAAYSMAHPIELSDGFIFDNRNLFVGIAAALFGWVGGLLALTIGSITRLLIGGGGAMLGVLSMSIAAAMGLIWHWASRRHALQNTLGFGLLGALISCHLFVLIFLPAGVRALFPFEFAAYFIGSNVLGAVIVGHLLEREARQIDQEIETQHAANTDPLTELMNRRALSQLTQNFKNTSPNGRAAFYFDVDHFKAINDEFGHHAGDDILVEIARRIRLVLRPDDHVSRLGGDEFVIVLPDIAEADALAIAERFQKIVSNTPIQVDGNDVTVTISLGAYWSNRDIAMNSLLIAADDQLYAAKSKGRNQVSFGGFGARASGLKAEKQTA